MEVFARELERAGEKSGEENSLILDNYIPAEGTYLIVQNDGCVRVSDIKIDKKTKDIINKPIDFEKICFLDYHSGLVSMDKPQDPKKTIHSNNYLSFWVKKDNFTTGKLNEEAIDRYFDVLANPRAKYTKPKDREMYDFAESQVGDIDQEFLEKNRQWIKDNIFELERFGVNIEGKSYLKIFFEAEREIYKRENNRYLIVKIFNKNDYNVMRQDGVYGLPNDNMGLNTKKPYLENKTRKYKIPYLITTSQALLQKKFFDYLMGQASAGKINIFFDTENQKIMATSRGEMVKIDFVGHYLQIQKGTEPIIQHQDVIVDYRFHLRAPFHFINVLETADKEEIYKVYRDKAGLQSVIDEVLFSGWLVNNYFTPIEDLQVNGVLKNTLVSSRDAIFSWLYKGESERIFIALQRINLALIKNSIINGWIGKAQKQFNLMCSFQNYFQGGKQMGISYAEIKNSLRVKINSKDTEKIESEKEYYYAVGQLVSYFISLSEAKEKNHSLANPFFNIRNDESLKKKLKQYFLKYNYKLKYVGSRFNNLYAMIENYDNVSKVDQDAIIAGYINSSLIYEAKKEEK